MSFQIKTGDTSPAIEYYLQDGDGNNEDISGASVRFLMREISSEAILVNEPAIIVEANEGHVKYEWIHEDTDDAGTYEAEWEVTRPDGTVETFPNEDFIEIKIYSDIN